MRRFILLAAFLLLRSGLAVAQVAPAAPALEAEGRRVALVIGIGAYEHASHLSASVDDAALMARTLRAFGFALVRDGPLVELDKPGFDAAVAEFGRMAQGAEIAFFYFSGHGLQHGGTNWLAARDSGPLSVPDEPRAGFIELQAVIRQLEAAQARLSVLVLEASRDDPFRRPDSQGGGLAAMRAPRGMLIVQAAQPGSIAPEGPGGRNSPFTTALVEAMGIPGLGLMQMFNEASLRVITASGGRQQPWIATSPMRGDFVFSAQEGATQPAEAPPVAARSPDFTLVNFAGRPVRELHASLASDMHWGQERLGANLLQAGERFRLTFPRDQGCHVDVRADFGQGAPSSVIRNLDTCAVDMLMLTPQGRLLPANPDVLLVNETGRPIQRIEASLTSEGHWGQDRLDGKVMAPGGTVELHLPQGLTCDVDIRVRFSDGGTREWRRQDTCAVSEYALR